MAGLLDFGGNPSTGGGLLDFIANDPGARMGLAMLAGSSPKYGRGLMQALQSQDDMKRQQLQAQIMQSQLEENKLQAQSRQAQMAQAQQKQALLSGLFGNPLAGVTSGGGLSAPQGGQMPQGDAQPMPQGQGRIAGLTLDQVAALKANGIDVADLWKTGREGFKRDAGAYYEGVDGGTKYMPKLDNGMMISGGQVMPAPGYAQSNAGIKGAETGAVEAARFPYTVGTDAARQNLAANLDVQKVYNPNTGREELLPRAQVVRPQQQYSGAGYAGGSSGAAAEGQRQIMQAELDKLPANHPDRAVIMREMQRLPTSTAPAQPGNYAAGPSAAELAAQEAAKARAVDTAKADVTRDTGRKSEEKLAGKLSTGVDRALELLNQGPTSSVVGNLADKGMGAFGYSTKGGDTAAQLEALSGWLVSNVPRMEGPQSNIDVQNYQTMAGRVGDRNLPIGTRKAAAEEVKRLQEKYSGLNGGKPDEDKPKGNLLESLPTPNASNKGQRIRDTNTGKILRSNGMQWKEE
jgi:hypothetical protein